MHTYLPLPNQLAIKATTPGQPLDYREVGTCVIYNDVIVYSNKTDLHYASKYLVTV